MLNQKELKVVVSTLAQRRAWLRKSLESTNVDPLVREENVAALKLLDSAISKLACTANASPKTPTPAPAPTPTPDKNTPTAVTNCRVLIAEDTEDSAMLLNDIVKDMGIAHIDLAKDGIEAFDFIRKAETPYHLILCDWDMPGLTGVEVHSKAKASNTLRGAHFIMVTAISDAARIKQAVQQGVNDYIVKPIDIEKLENKIRTSIGLAT